MTDAREAVLHLWRALAERDWEALKTVVSDDCIFLDMPFGPTLAARGPDEIVKRLKSGLENENLANWANHDLLLLTNGIDVMYEHLVIYTSTTRPRRRKGCIT
jgi:ketosteroid isomerase-like protein